MLVRGELARVLTVQEQLALSGFPRDYALRGTRREQVMQVGNAVPARLGTVAGETVARIIDDASLDCADAPRATQTYLNSHVRTRRWWKDGQAVVQA